uniref:Xanthine phosphoribosyltransferase 1 n=1 Tax=Moniliophthora roreri TaxID=221103 RepID=A0A0W0FZE8_MONRR
MSNQVKHWHVTYNDIHNLIRKCTPQIASEFNPDFLLAIGMSFTLYIRLAMIVVTGILFRWRVSSRGFFPARVMRTFLREQTDNKTLQIQAIGLSLYEPVEGITAEQIGQEVIRTQWLTNAGKKILGKRVLIVDEVDDTRKTLGYALAELKKDVEEELLNHPEPERNALREATKFGIFVVHNKLKPKLAELPPGTPYYAGANVGDLWVDYPWEVINIEEHDKLAALDLQSASA